MRSRPDVFPAGVAILLLYALFSRTLIAVAVPPWQGPDEMKHFEYVRTLVDRRDQLLAERRLLTLDDGIPELQTQIIASMARYHFWEFLGTSAPKVLPANFAEAFGTSPTQLHRPSLYYMMGALVLLPLPGLSLEQQLLVMRVLSAVLSSLAVFPAYIIGRLLTPRDAFVPIACAALVAMLPMGVYVGGMMNNDNLLLLLGMLAVLSMTLGVTRGFTFKTWVAIVSSIVLGLLTKRGAVILLPAALVCASIWLVRLREPLRRWVVAGVCVTVALTIVAASTGALTRILPVDRAQSTLIAYALNSPSQWNNLLRVPLASAQTRQIVGVELGAYFNSFWGIFGWFAVGMRPEIYTALLVITAICAGGFGVWSISTSRGQNARRVVVAVLFVTLIGAAVVAGLAERLAYFSVYEVPQGRYLFVVLGAIAPVYAIGTRVLVPCSRVGTRLPTAVFVGALVALDVYAYLGAIQPFFSRSFR